MEANPFELHKLDVDMEGSIGLKNLETELYIYLFVDWSIFGERDKFSFELSFDEDWVDTVKNAVVDQAKNIWKKLHPDAEKFLAAFADGTGKVSNYIQEGFFWENLSI